MLHPPFIMIHGFIQFFSTGHVSKSFSIVLEKQSKNMPLPNPVFSTCTRYAMNNRSSSVELTATSCYKFKVSSKD
jgi:hypothetical protein